MSNYPARRRLIVTVESRDPYSPAPAPKPGDVYCVIAAEDLSPTPAGWRKSLTRWHELTADPRTNQGRVSLWDGWLGATNDVSRTAQGAYRVVSVTEHDDAFGARYLVSLAKVA